MHQKAYRTRQKEKKKAQKKQYLEGTKKHNQNITVRRIGEDRKKEEKIIEDIKGEEIKANNSEDPNTPNSNNLETSPPLPSNSESFNEGKNNLLQEYLSRLRDCPGYPFDEYKDTSLFHYITGEYPNINILEQLDKKIAWWKDRSDALKPSASPRNKLAEWFEKEHEFQNRRDY